MEVQNHTQDRSYLECGVSLFDSPPIWYLMIYPDGVWCNLILGILADAIMDCAIELFAYTQFHVMLN